MHSGLAQVSAFVAPPSRGRFWRELWYRTAITGALIVGVIRAVGGTIRLESEPGRGTTVSITLPRADVGGAEHG